MPHHPGVDELTHWGRVTHICVSDLTSIGSDNGLSSGRRQAIIRTNAGILLIRTLGTNFSVFLVEMLIFSFKKMRLKVSSAKRRPFCLGLNELSLNCAQGGPYWNRTVLLHTVTMPPFVKVRLECATQECHFISWTHPLQPQQGWLTAKMMSMIHRSTRTRDRIKRYFIMWQILIHILIHCFQIKRQVDINNFMVYNLHSNIFLIQSSEGILLWESL